MDSGIEESTWPDLPREAFDRFHIWLRPAGARFEVVLGERVLDPELRTPEVTARVSPLSAIPSVRAWLLDAQREAGKEGALVADGRDMGTVVFPDAEVKIFLTAELPERARRRFLERNQRSPTIQETESEARTIKERDERDSGRAIAPLRKPRNAFEVDTSNLSFEDQVQIIIDHVKSLTER
jgi:cytidylate kinase